MNEFKRLLLGAAALSVSLLSQAQLSFSDNSMMFDYFFMTAMQFKTQGNLQKAMESLGTCRKLNPKSATVDYEISKIFEFAQQYDHAAEFANSAVQKDTCNNIEFIVSAISINKQVQNYQGNILLYDKLIAIEPNVVSNYLQKAFLQQDELEDYDGALQTLDKALKLNDQSSYWRIQRTKADIFYDQGNVKKSLKLFDKIIARPDATAEDYYHYSLLLSELDNKKKDFSRSINVCKKATVMDDGSYYLEFLAELYIRNGEPDIADKTLSEYFSNVIIDIDSKRKTLYEYLTDKWHFNYASSRKETFVSILNILKQQYPGDCQLCALREAFYKALDEPKRADAELLEFVEKYDGDEYIWRAVLNILMKEDARLSKLIDYSERASKDVPNNFLFKMLNGEYYLRDRQYRKALPPLRESYSMVLQEDEKLNPQLKEVKISILHNIANCYFYTDSLDQAFAIYDQLLATDPDDALALNNYAYYLAINGRDLQKAEQMSSRSLKSQPTNTSFLDTYAYILYHNNSYREALFVMERCLDALKTEGIPPSAEVLDHYADILFLNGKKDEAIAKWNECLTLSNHEMPTYYGADKVQQKISAQRYIK